MSEVVEQCDSPGSNSDSDTSDTEEYVNEPPIPPIRINIGSRKRKYTPTLVGSNGINAIYGSDEPLKKRIRNIDIKSRISTLDELIKLAEEPADVCVRRAYNSFALQQMLPTLRKLNNTIGMKMVKTQVVNMILFNLSGVDSANPLNYHTVIEGQPGVGKTMLGHILAEIYCGLGIISTTNIIFAKRNDLIAGYLGQTAIKTQRVIDSAENGVLFIDEAYSLGNSEGRDSYSKECIDTINRNLTERAGAFVCVIAGYAGQLQSCFFAQNSGLERRFPYRFTIDAYTPAELYQIFELMVRKDKWELEANATNEQFFATNIKFFKFMGGDIEILFQKCKITHVSRIFGIHDVKKRLLTREDITDGFELFKANPSVRDRDDTDTAPLSMYI